MDDMVEGVKCFRRQMKPELGVPCPAVAQELNRAQLDIDGVRLLWKHVEC